LGYFDVIWEIPPEAFTVETNSLEVSISFYDLLDKKIAFSWNVPTFTGFKVGPSCASVGENIETHYIPAADEVLMVNEELRSIIAPAQYNNVVGNYGD
jgi:hypothetical protein